MINIPLPFWAMWGIMLLGVLTKMLYDIKVITDKTPDSIIWKTILQKFFNKEWPSYGMAIIITGIISFSFEYIKQFDTSQNADINKWAKWVPLAVLILYAIGITSQLILYKFLGRIKSKGMIDESILKEKPNDQS